MPSEDARCGAEANSRGNKIKIKNNLKINLKNKNNLFTMMMCTIKMINDKIKINGNKINGNIKR